MQSLNYMRSPCGWRRRNWRKKIMWRGKTTKLMTSEWLQRVTVSTCKIVAHYNRKLKPLSHSFNSAYQIYSRADHGKVEPVGRTDIAIDSRADVKRDNDLKRRLACERRVIRKPTHGLDGLDGCGQCPMGGSTCLIGRVDWENRE